MIFICCSFRGGILSAVFPTVAICFWPAGNLECPCLFSDLILFPFLLLFFYIVPYPSFSSMSFSLIYICCILLGRHCICCFPHCSHLFLTRREPGVPLSLFRPYPLPFSPLFLLLFLTLPFLLCLFHWPISAVASGEAFYLCFPHCSHLFLTRREPGVPLSLFRPYPLPFSPLFLLLFLTLPFLLCFFHWSISAVVSGEAFYLLFSPL